MSTISVRLAVMPNRASLFFVSPGERVGFARGQGNRGSVPAYAGASSWSTAATPTTR